MSEDRLSACQPGSGPPACPEPWFPIAALFLLVGVFAWLGDDPSPPVELVLTNPTAEPWSVDVVWEGPEGRVVGSLLRVVDPGAQLRYPLRPGSVACVRWIAEAEALVEAEWPVGARSPTRGPLVVLPPPSAEPSPHYGKDCPPELAEHPIRPALGRWMLPGDPHRTFRERIVPRTPSRRQARRRNDERRGELGSLADRLLPSAGGS